VINGGLKLSRFVISMVSMMCIKFMVELSCFWNYETDSGRIEDELLRIERYMMPVNPVALEQLPSSILLA